MKARSRVNWADMDHDDELLLERIVRRSSAAERGPIPEFLNKKKAEQEHKTRIGYRTSLTKFNRQASTNSSSPILVGQPS